MLSLPSFAAHYSFTNIIDSTSSLGHFTAPRISDNGVVLFHARDSSFIPGLYTTTGTSLTTIATYNQYEFTSYFHSINSSGTVVFYSYGYNSGVYTSDGTTINTVADGSGQFADNNFYISDINSSGTVVFQAKLDTGPSGFFTRNGNGPVVPIVDTSGPFRGFVAPAINSQGSIAFTAELDDETEGTYLFDGLSLVKIADNTADFISLNGIPDINDSGVVAFSASLAGDDHGIYLYDNGLISTFVDTLGPFDSIYSDPAINNNGDRAFQASLDDFGYGIYTGPDPIADCVIKNGDILFGASAYDLVFGGINNNGDIVFTYQLDNYYGISGIAVAHRTPEPASAVLFFLTASLLTCRRSRRKHLLKR
jgi:hypothetical protein